MLVVDASVIVAVVADDGDDGDLARRRLRGEHLVAPDLVAVETVSALRRLVAASVLGAADAERAIDDLHALPVTYVPTMGVMRRAWALRGNVTVADACYVALAELLGCTLLTADARLGRAPGVRCEVEVLRSDAEGPG